LEKDSDPLSKSSEGHEKESEANAMEESRIVSPRATKRPFWISLDVLYGDHIPPESAFSIDEEVWFFPIECNERPQLRGDKTQ
jgi:hypothetical protein